MDDWEEKYTAQPNEQQKQPKPRPSQAESKQCQDKQSANLAQDMQIKKCQDKQSENLAQSPRYQDLCSLMNTRSANKIMGGPSNKLQQNFYCFYCKTQVQETHRCSYLETFVKIDRQQLAVYQDDQIEKLIGTEFGEPKLVKHFKFHSDLINYLHHDAIDKHYIRHKPATTTLDAILCQMHPFSVQCINRSLMRSKAPFTRIQERTIVELRPNPWAERLMREYHKYIHEDDPKRLNIYHIYHRIHPGKLASILFGYLNMDDTNEQPQQHLLGVVQEIEWLGDELTGIPPQLFQFLKGKSTCLVDGKKYILDIQNKLLGTEEVEERIKAGKRVVPRRS